MTATWTSSKSLILGIFLLVLTSVAAAQITGQGSYDSSEISADTGFSIPEYSSHQEILTELVAPFIFLTVLLHFALTKALHFTLAEEDYGPQNPFAPNRAPNVKRYSLVMSLAITGALVPTVIWDYVLWSIRLLGVTSLLFFIGLILFVLYLMSGR